MIPTEFLNLLFEDFKNAKISLSFDEFLIKKNENLRSIKIKIDLDRIMKLTRRRQLRCKLTFESDLKSN